MPPLNAVRAFCAAARHGSFTGAAGELHVTPGAVSRQVQSLEAFLGRKLFERRVRQIVLTPAGADLYGEAGAALDRIARASDTRATAGEPVRIVVNVRASFAQKWLIPRLADVRRDLPGVVLDLQTTTEAPRKCAPFDIAIRHSASGWPEGWTLHEVLRDELVLIFPRAAGARTEVQALLERYPVVRSRTRLADWQRWSSGAGEAATAATFVDLDHVNLVVQAVMEGVGIAAVPLSLVEVDLAKGRVRRMKQAQKVPLRPYYCGLPADAPPAAARFLQWLQSAALPKR